MTACVVDFIVIDEATVDLDFTDLPKPETGNERECS